MITRLLPVLTFVSALGSGLSAGLLFIFSACVMTALGRLPAAQGVAAMQSINVTILNPWFITVYFGTAAICIVLATASIFGWSEPGAGYMLAGSVLYMIGTIVVTIAFNVPLNDALAGVEATSDDAGRLWARFLVTWTGWNHVRAAAALAAMACFVMAFRLLQRIVP
jgi:uncharacterized membrane protein